MPRSWNIYLAPQIMYFINLIVLFPVYMVLLDNALEALL